MIRKIFGIAFVIIICTFFYISHKKQSQKLRLGGWAEGSLFNYTLKLYPDNTYYLTNVEDQNGTWFEQNDTFVLMYHQDTCAKIYKEKLVTYNCNQFRILTLMRFVERTPADVIIFPK